MDTIEGYAGIPVWEGQWIGDVTLSLLLLLFVCFAFVFHHNCHLFIRMVKDILGIRKRLSLFEEAKGDDTSFYRFMITQSLFLCSLFIFVFGCKAQSFAIRNVWEIPVFLVLIFGITSLYYQCRKFLNYVVVLVFVKQENYELWQAGYKAIISSWGVLLYIPVGWLALWNGEIIYPFLSFVSLYILSRLAVIYKIMKIFSIKKSDYLYLLLYLCAQELMPFFLIIIGIDYLYNFIEMTIIWS